MRLLQLLYNILDSLCIIIILINFFFFFQIACSTHYVPTVVAFFFALAQASRRALDFIKHDLHASAQIWLTTLLSQPTGTCAVPECPTRIALLQRLLSRPRWFRHFTWL